MRSVSALHPHKNSFIVTLPAMRNRILSLAIVATAITSCTAPRVINQSGRVTPKGNFTGGLSYTANIPTATTGLLLDVAEQTVRDVANKDSIVLDNTVESINKAAVAYAVDPLGSGYDLYLRYGLFNKFEIGYKRAGSAHVFMGQYQFLSPGDENAEVAEGLHGSIGLQYCSQKYKLPSKLEELQSRLGYSFKRKDLLVPLIFSYSFGPNEKYGSVAFGLAYSYSLVTYTTLPDRIFDDKGMPVFGKQHRRGYSSVGGFVNLKLGYEYVYIIPALSIYYQDYGNYHLIDGSTFHIKGFTFVPSISLQLTTGQSIKRKR
jgi:hypothetical protein